ncbi:MAG: hypothetical protein EHM58_00395 [Ignavibacteriae bacterium]|nr:MAG: hypothetical protein EHM58_00395 [Ignavibacteriota bacterium]
MKTIIIIIFFIIGICFYQSLKSSQNVNFSVNRSVKENLKCYTLILERVNRNGVWWIIVYDDYYRYIDEYIDPMNGIT